MISRPVWDSAEYARGGGCPPKKVSRMCSVARLAGLSPCKSLAPMGAQRDGEPNILGTPLVALAVSYGRSPCLGGVDGINGACTMWFVRDAGAAGGVRVGSHVWFSVEP